jgi:signal transduction histidine kinase
MLTEDRAYAARVSGSAPSPTPFSQSVRVAGSWLKRHVWESRWRPRSLRGQIALGSALITLAPIFVLTLTAFFTIALSFNDVQKDQITSQTQVIAQALGKSGDLSSAALLNSAPPDKVGVWVMASDGSLVTQPVTPNSDFAADTSRVLSALRSALQGRPTTIKLVNIQLTGGNGLLFLQRYGAVAPIFAGGATSGRVIGAVALATAPLHERQPFVRYLSSATRALLLVTLAVALLAIALAALFARTLTRSLARLTGAVALMATGDYAARARVSGPTEVEQLATTFNEMATALERDVNELKRQERLRRDLVADVSHELATPLTSIQGYSEALRDGVAGPERLADLTGLIIRQVERLRRLVDQMRQVALYEADAGRLTLATVDLPDLLDETLAVVEPELERKRITPRITLDADLPLITADADRLTEALLNLLDNAIYHTPEEGEIEVSVARDGQWAQVSVANSGPGLTEEQRGRVFDRFYRTDEARATSAGGSGLGLAIVKAIVEAHGGRIRVDDRPGGGARFRIALPL